MTRDHDFFERITSNVTAMIAVYNIHTGIYEYVNEGITIVLGYMPSDFIEGGVPYATSLVHPSDLPLISEKNLRELERANKGENVHAAFEYRMRHKDGSWRWLQTDGSVFSRNANGEVECVLNVSIDITAQKEAESLLRVRLSQEPTMIEAIVNSTDDAIVSKTLDGIIRTWNRGAEKIFGYSAAEAIGQHITLIIPPERLEEETIILSRLRRGEKIDHFDTKRMRKDGSLVDVSITISPIRTASGEIIGASKIARDITLRKRHEENLREEKRRKDEFLAVLAHELRNPLSPISSAVSILQLSEAGSNESKWAVDVINRQLQHMTRLIDDLLDISRIAGNKLQLRKEMISMTEVIQSAIETSEPLIRENGHKFLTAFSTRSIFVEGDAVRLSQIVSNLLTNAAKYTPRGGTIWLECDADHNTVTITVRDTGIGIPKELLPKIFDMFVQGDGSLQSSKGLGIGLTLVQRLLQLHGGEIEVASDGPGKGSVFTARLPRVYPPLLADGTGDKKSVTNLGLKILVADDNPDAVHTLEMALRLQGNETIVAHDGLEAVKRAREFSPDVILLDIGMPNMNGLEAARLIRANPWGQSVKLIAVTGWGQDADKERTKEAGFDFHLTKPVNALTLSELLSSFLEQKTLR